MKYYTVIEAAELLKMDPGSISSAINNKRLLATNDPQKRKLWLISDYALRNFKKARDKRAKKFYSIHKLKPDPSRKKHPWG